MSGILWHMEQNMEGILDGILMEFHMLILEDKNQIQKSMYISWYLSSSFYSSFNQQQMLRVAQLNNLTTLNLLPCQN